MNSEGGKPGNVLTVNGNYTGNNGLMTFNATLGGDNSPTDKMNVKGDTQGNTRVRVDNIGGVGAQTVNGIELIEVGGNSAGNNFSVFIQAGGSYRLTPFYDIISAFPVLGGTGIHISDLKLAMGLNASKGKKTAIDKIYPRHFWRQQRC